MNEKKEFTVVLNNDPRVKLLLDTLTDNIRNIADGIYPCKITQFEFREGFDKFKNRDAIFLVPTFDIINDDGENVALTKFLGLSWTEKSNLKKLAKATGTLPEKGESFNPDNILGASLQVSIENEEKEGKSISKIVDFFPSKKAKSSPTPIPKIPSKKSPELRNVDLSEFDFYDDND